jgi:hypothetical protein
LSLITAHSTHHLQLRRRTILQAVEDQLDARRGAELVEYSKQIIAHCMFAEAHVAGDLAVGEAFGNQADYVFFALGKQVEAARVLQVQGFGVAEGVEQLAEVLAIGPDLTLMHGVDALRKSFERLVAENNAVRTAAEGVNHQVAIARGQQHHRARLCFQLFGWRGRAGGWGYGGDRAGLCRDARRGDERVWICCGVEFAGGVCGAFIF